MLAARDRAQETRGARQAGGETQERARGTGGPANGGDRAEGGLADQMLAGGDRAEEARGAGQAGGEEEAGDHRAQPASRAREAQDEANETAGGTKTYTLTLGWM